MLALENLTVVFKARVEHNGSFMRLPVILTVFLACVPVQSQHAESGKESKNPAIGNPEAIAKGAKLFAGSCAACHGPDGSGGRGPNLVRRAAWHPLTDEGTFSTIRNGVPGADMPPTKLPDDQTWNLVAFVHALTGPASESSVEGDPVAGEKIFWGSKAGCSNCHAIRGRGSRMGPDLSIIGANQPLTLIRASLLQPSKQPSFRGKESVTVTMKDGSTIVGLARNRSNYALQVVDRNGDLHLISMADVKALSVLERSGMPDDYGKRLSAEEVRDVLAYLARQTARTSESSSRAHTDTP
jgi:putative heme-binding domain-containing protein